MPDEGADALDTDVVLPISSAKRKFRVHLSLSPGSPAKNTLLPPHDNQQPHGGVPVQRLSFPPNKETSAEPHTTYPCPASLRDLRSTPDTRNAPSLVPIHGWQYVDLGE